MQFYWEADHGKTTLVDPFLRQSNVFRDFAQADEAGERVKESNDRERERGIAILSNNFAIMRNGVNINIIVSELQMFVVGIRNVGMAND